jgi:hypothetical protein
VQALANSTVGRAGVRATIGTANGFKVIRRAAQLDEAASRIPFAPATGSALGGLGASFFGGVSYFIQAIRLRAPATECSTGPSALPAEGGGFQWLITC